MWLAGNWTLVDAIPDSEIDKFVTTPGVSSPYSNRYVIGASRLISKIRGGRGISRELPSAGRSPR